MPRIPDNFLESIIYLYPSITEAQRGLFVGSEKKKGGSGCFVSIPCMNKPGQHFIYAVTNRHIVKNGNTVIRLTTKQGDSDYIETDLKSWFYYDNQDLAVCPIGLDVNHKFRAISDNTFITKDALIKDNIGIGDDLFVVGRFVNHEGRQTNLPSVRFGNIAMLPGEDVIHGANSPPFQESFLADIRTVSGYSGSPVIMYPRLVEVRFSYYIPDDSPHVMAPVTKTLWLIGIEWGHLNDGHRNDTGMSGIVPAWVLRDLLNHPQLIAFRELTDLQPPVMIPTTELGFTISSPTADTLANYTFEKND